LKKLVVLSGITCSPGPIRTQWNLAASRLRTRGQTSLEFKNLTDKPENAYLKQIPNVVAVGGGVPIKAGNEVIGGVGVAGAPGGDKDEVCANAGIAKVADA
jgi:uncharacterized protein GlcG (DUF336 family)